MNEINDELLIIPIGQELQTVSKIDLIIADIRNKVKPLVADVNTAKGRKEIISNAFRVTKTKTAITTLIDNLIAQKEVEIKPVLNIIAELKENKKKANAELSQFAQEIRTTVTEWEENNTKRINFHKSKIDEIINAGKGNGNCAYLKDTIELLEKLPIDSSYQEFELEARKAKEEAIERLRDALAMQLIKEKEAEELALLRKEAAEREQKEREEKIRIEAEEQANLATKLLFDRLEREKQEFIIKAQEAERAKIATEERAKIQTELAAQQARQEEIAKQERIALQEKLEQEARENNKRHVASIRTGIKTKLISFGLDEDLAKRIILAIDNNQIPNLIIKY